VGEVVLGINERTINIGDQTQNYSTSITRRTEDRHERNESGVGAVLRLFIGYHQRKLAGVAAIGPK